MQTLLQDLRFAMRMLAKNPGFTTAAALTLALGISANTAIFSVVNAVLLRPLPYPKSDRLIWLSERGPNWNGGPISYPNYMDWKAQQTVFEQIGVFNWNSFALTGKGEPVQLRGAQMNADVFKALRVQPAAGRFFSDDEDKPGAPAVVVFSHALWQTHFGGDPGIAGQTVSLDGKPYTVIGVAPVGFAFPNELSLWVPAGPRSAESDWQNRKNHPGLYGVARLKEGVTIEKARTEMDEIAKRLEEQYPETNKTRRVQLEGLLDSGVQGIRRALWVLLGAVALVLLIACANVANLLLARAAVRQKEMAVRAALGAGKWQIMRQLLTESLLLAGIGGAGGLLLANGSLGLIVRLAKDSVPRLEEVGLSPTVLGFSCVLALVAGVGFGLAPAWYASRTDLQETLKGASRGTTTERARLRHGLIVAQVALTFLLLTGAGLLLRSFYRLQKVNAGFVSERVLTFAISLPQRKYGGEKATVAFYQSLLEKLRALPGVQAAAISSRIPLEASGWDTSFLIEGQPVPAPHERPAMDLQVVNADYFQVMGIPLPRGRTFLATDNQEHVRGTRLADTWGGALNVIVVDEEFARRHWPNEDPIGKRLRMDWGPDSPMMTVIGEVGTVKWRRLNEERGNVQAYLPFSQLNLLSMTVALKTSLEPSLLIASARQQVLALDPEQPIYEIRTLGEMRDKNLAPQRLNFTLLCFFAATGLALAAIGLYGVLAYAVTQRRREIGVRMALGAERRTVMGLVIRQGMRLTLIGVGFGLIAAIALTRVLQRLLFEVKPFDPSTFLVVPVVLAGVAFLACWFPARRAADLDPMEALRYD